MFLLPPPTCSERPLDALLGKAFVFQTQQQMTKALECIDECIVIHDWYHPALATKAITLAIMGDWSQALDLAERSMAKSKGGRDISGLIVACLFYLVRDGDAEAVSDRL